MRVVLVNTVCGYGSTGRIATELGSFLQNSGNECLIAHGRYSNSEYSPKLRIGSDFTTRKHVLLSRITDRQGFYSCYATKQFISAINNYQPDIIHLHNIHGYYLNFQLLFDYFKMIHIPIVWTFHDCWPFTGHCTYFDTVNCKKWLTKCGSCVQKREYPASYFADNSRKNFSDKMRIFTSVSNLHIVTPSKWLHDLVGNSFLRHISRRVINNGVNLNHFIPKSSNFRYHYNLKDKTILLGVASIWGPRKGFDDFIKLSHIINDKTVIVLVGVSKQQKNLLSKNIIGINRTNSIDELCELYSSANFFLNLTYQDNFPSTNIEALACGTPVITYRTGGSTESIMDTCGHIIDRGDYMKIPSLLLNKKFDYTACVEHAQRYSSEKSYSEYFNLYRKLLYNES